MPYANILGPDPIPDRSHVFFVSCSNPVEGVLPSPSLLIAGPVCRLQT
jgi:hypothetical protein